MLRLYDKNNVDITDERIYCGNSECLGEPWCSAWGICRAKQSATMEQEVNRLSSFEFDHIEEQDTSPTSPVPFCQPSSVNSHSSTNPGEFYI